MWLAALLISFHEASESFAGQEVVMVGFLTCNDQQQWFLAKEPNIKSCCIGKKKEIRLVGEFSPELKNKVIKVQGVLQMENGKPILIGSPVAKN